MSADHTNLSRPRRSSPNPPRKGRWRGPSVTLAVLVLSGCTAVAADRLPSDRASTSPTDTSDVAAQQRTAESAVADDTTPSPLLSHRLPADDDRTNGHRADGHRPDGHQAEGDRSEDDRSRGQTDGGTIVAHGIVDEVVARDEPSERAAAVASFTNPTDRGGPLVFQALGDPQGEWIEVLLPVRPNNTAGWIRLADVELTRNPYRIEIDLNRYQLTIRHHNEIRLTAPIAIGETDTPTPLGHFYLIELLRPPDPDGPYGTYAYGLSGYSDVLERFNGGAGVIGIHGTNQPELLGGPASHGCIRVNNETIDEMAGFLPLGTPVSIGRAVVANGIR